MSMDSNCLLSTINDQTIGLQTPLSGAEKSIRTGARAILFDNDNRIALVYEHKYNHYKLPGGNVEVGESLEQTVRREIKEEVGRILQISTIWVLYNHICRHITRIVISIILPHMFMERSAKALGLTKKNCTAAQLFGVIISSKLLS